MQKYVMLWRDAEGAPEWLNGVVRESAGLELVVEGIQKSELFGVILEKAAEIQEEEGADVEGEEGEDGEDDEDDGEDDEEDEDD
eukprot:9469067-Pyramimonas_sp.AAC.2